MNQVAEKMFQEEEDGKKVAKIRKHKLVPKIGKKDKYLFFQTQSKRSANQFVEKMSLEEEDQSEEVAYRTEVRHNLMLLPSHGHD